MSRLLGESFQLRTFRENRSTNGQPGRGSPSDNGIIGNILLPKPDPLRDLLEVHQAGSAPMGTLATWCVASGDGP